MTDKSKEKFMFNTLYTLVKEWTGKTGKEMKQLIKKNEKKRYKEAKEYIKEYELNYGK